MPDLAFLRRVEHDGRVGYPEVAEYELTEDPDAGRRLPVPPSPQAHPFKREYVAAQGRFSMPPTGWMRPDEATAAYKLVIHDLATYEVLEATGFWASEAHYGVVPPAIDQRAAPGAG